MLLPTLTVHDAAYSAVIRDHPDGVIVLSNGPSAGLTVRVVRDAPAQGYGMWSEMPVDGGISMPTVQSAAA